MSVDKILKIIFVQKHTYADLHNGIRLSLFLLLPLVISGQRLTSPLILLFVDLAGKRKVVTCLLPLFY